MFSPVEIFRHHQRIKNLGKKGKIISWCIIRSAPAEFKDQAPYAVAIAKLEDGELIVGQVVDSPLEKIKMGAKVEVVLRRLLNPRDDSPIPYGLKLRLLSS